jgi:hypothetical protein
MTMFPALVCILSNIPCFSSNACAAGHIQSCGFGQCFRRLSPHRQRRRRAAGTCAREILSGRMLFLLSLFALSICVDVQGCSVDNGRTPFTAKITAFCSTLLTAAAVRIYGIDNCGWPFVIRRHPLAFPSDRLTVLLPFSEYCKSRMFHNRMLGCASSPCEPCYPFPHKRGHSTCIRHKETTPATARLP